MRMEWLEAASKFALKSSTIRSEFTTNTNTSSHSMKPSSCPSPFSPQLVDDFVSYTGLNGEDFSVDEYFDLPAGENDVFDQGSNNSKEDGGSYDVLEEENEEDNVSGGGDQIDDYDCDGAAFSNSSFLGCDSEQQLSAAELAVRVDDMKELELWSHLMDDTVTESYSYPPPSPPPSMLHNPMKTGFQFHHHHLHNTKPEFKNCQRVPVQSNISCVSVAAAAIPVKPRSKRPRTITGRTWSCGSPPKSSDSDSSSSSTSPTSVTLFRNPVIQGMELFYCGTRPPAVKKPKKPSQTTIKRDSGNGNGIQTTTVVQQRRCTHCLVTKTPQWRAGPLGPKTLCNACGVRFKSGRLYPEYRPACSPTFSSDLHSNSHRKVLEMRKKKEVVVGAGEGEAEPQPELSAETGGSTVTTAALAPAAAHASIAIMTINNSASTGSSN